jgi:pimeloyl-ACP methyl ester carboxylesterase
VIQDTLNLADGRTLSYSQWGPPDATPVFYFDGFPTSRREFELARPRLEQSNLPVRVIAIDRPGFGTSTAKPNRTFLDWPTDVTEAADLLDIDRYRRWPMAR